jgi:hypothetical protein
LIVPVRDAVKSLPEPKPLGGLVIHLEVHHFILPPKEKNETEANEEKQQHENSGFPDGHALSG